MSSGAVSCPKCNALSGSTRATILILTIGLFIAFLLIMMGGGF
jgi:hypothetical protein